MYNIICTRCKGIENYRNQSESISKGCGGCNGTINHKRINVQLCSKCYSPKTLNEELGKQLPEVLKKKYGVNDGIPPTDKSVGILPNEL